MFILASVPVFELAKAVDTLSRNQHMIQLPNFALRNRKSYRFLQGPKGIWFGSPNPWAIAYDRIAEWNPLISINIKILLVVSRVAHGSQLVCFSAKEHSNVSAV